MNKQCNINLLKVIDLTNEMKSLANTGLASSEDDNCVILYGLLRDAAYKIMSVAEKEVSNHRKLNKWE